MIRVQIGAAILRRIADTLDNGERKIMLAGGIESRIGRRIVIDALRELADIRERDLDAESRIELLVVERNRNRRLIDDALAERDRFRHERDAANANKHHYMNEAIAARADRKRAIREADALASEAHRIRAEYDRLSALLAQQVASRPVAITAELAGSGHDGADWKAEAEAWREVALDLHRALMRDAVTYREAGS